MDYIQDNIPINVSFGETMKVINTRQGGKNGWGTWLARWGRDVLGLVGKPDGKKITCKTWVYMGQ